MMTVIYPARGSRPPPMSTLLFGPFRLLPEQWTLLAHDKPVRLGSCALDILITMRHVLK